MSFYYVIARVEDDEIKHYLSKDGGPAKLDDPQTLVFKDEAKAKIRASHDHTSNTVLRIHQDFLDVAAI